VFKLHYLHEGFPDRAVPELHAFRATHQFRYQNSAQIQ
jgi:hypothetical protein